jgi:hypothetical protein
MLDQDPSGQAAHEGSAQGYWIGCSSYILIYILIITNVGFSSHLLCSAVIDCNDESTLQIVSRTDEQYDETFRSLVAGPHFHSPDWFRAYYTANRRDTIQSRKVG